MKKILFVFAGGGFLNESVPLYDALKKKFKIELVVSKDIDYECLPDIVKMDNVKLSYMMPVTLRSQSSLQNSLMLLRATVEAFFILAKNDAEYIICLGSSMALPLFFIAKLLQKKTIFIESIARVEGLSKTASTLLKLRIVDRCYVQWEEQESEIQNSLVLYKGSVL